VFPVVHLQKKHLINAFVGAPLCLLINFDSLIAPVSDWSLRNMLGNRLFGSILMDDFRTLPELISGIAFIILFMILWSGYFPSHFRFSCVYVFSRIRSRVVWFLSRCLELLLYALMYSLLYILVGILLCWRVTGSPFSVSDFAAILGLWLFSTLLLFNLSLLMSLIALRWGSLTGFIMTQAVLFGLILLEYLFSAIPAAVMCNPASLLQFLVLPKKFICISFGVNCLIMLLLFILGCRYIQRYDIALFDAEVN